MAPTDTPSTPDRDQVLAALSHVRDPKSGATLVEAGLIQGLAVGPGRAGFMLEVEAADVALYTPVSEAAETALLRVPGVERAQVVLTTRESPGAPAPSEAYRVEARARPREQAPAHAHPHKPAPRPQPVPFVRRVVAVASGKGGVGKSTVAVNLAAALARRGLKVGLMDADIYGPSLPRMLGEHRRPEVRNERMVPVSAWGLKAMSMGLLVDENSAMIWRGPMIMGAVQQFLGQVEWGELDVLVVDLPPGTGDIQLTLSQRVQVSGAVIVSTPQDIALIDARRAVRMFEKVEIPVFGLIENMSVFCCPNCGHRSEIFGHGGARAEAAKLGHAFLGEIPLLLDVRSTSDAGTPIVAAAPESEGARPFITIAEGLAGRLKSQL
jgi:ATP-binding protein involved in chromosome partitioning